MPYADQRAGLRDPDDVGNFSISELDAYVACLREQLSPGEFEALRPQIVELYTRVLERPYPDEEEIIVPSGSLFIEALPGTAPVLEDYKLLHRVIDVTKAAAEVRGRELENLRYAARINANVLADPEIQTMVVAPNGAQIAVPAGGGGGTSDGPDGV